MLQEYCSQGWLLKSVDSLGVETACSAMLQPSFVCVVWSVGQSALTCIVLRIRSEVQSYSDRSLSGHDVIA